MNSYSGSLVLFFWLFVVAVACCLPVHGSEIIIPALVAGYFMLVSGNSISRGEKRAQKARGKRR